MTSCFLLTFPIFFLCQNSVQKLITSNNNTTDDDVDVCVEGDDDDDVIMLELYPF